MTTTLSGYVTTGTLSNYVTSSSLTTTLNGYAQLGAGSNSFTGNMTLGSNAYNTHTINGLVTFTASQIKLNGSSGTNIVASSQTPSTYEFGSAALSTGSFYVNSTSTTLTPLWVKRNGTWIDVSYTDDSRFPSTDQKNALSGTSGTPGSSNAYVTNNDSRMSDARANTTWMTVSEKSGLMTQNNDERFILGHGGAAVLSSFNTTQTGFSIYLDPADYAVTGRTATFRLRVIVQVNTVTTVKSTGFVIGLMSMANDRFWSNFFGDAGNQAKTYPALTSRTAGASTTGLVTNSNCSPGSDIAPVTSGSVPGYGTFTSSSFSVGSANRYAIYVQSPSTSPAGMSLATGTGNALSAEIVAFLQVRYT